MNAQQLKNAILQEAIEGRLVPQDPNDEPASALLQRIRAEKERLVKEGKLKKKDLVETPISEDEKPFEIPEGWVWVRWGELGVYKKGPFGSSLTKSMFVPQTDEAVKVYEQKNAIQKNYLLGDYYISKEKYKTMTGFTVRPGDIIVSCAGTIGETYLLPPDAPVGIINQALMRAKLHLDSIIPYWLLYFRYILVIENKLKGAGSAIKNIPPFEMLKAMPVALPPLAEQKRIVAKIEGLLPKVEEYGKAQEALDKLNEELPERLKKSILQEAITGRLVPQDPNDEPASVLLAKIRKEKEQLVKEGKLKKKDLDEVPIKRDEVDFVLPAGWEWCRLGTLAEFINGLAFKPEEWKNNGLPIIRIQNLTDSNRPINYTTKVFDNRFKVENGDLLFSWSATLDSFIWNGKTAWLNQHIFKVNPYGAINKKWLFYALKAIVVQLSFVTHGLTMKHLTRGVFENYPIALPPLSEQHRIVEKLEQLLGEIDKLNN